MLKSIKNKHDVYGSKDCMKKFCESLREHAMKIINFFKKMETKEQQKLNRNAKICYICKEKFENKYFIYKKYREVRDHCHYAGEYGGAAHDIFNLKYSLPKKFNIAFHNGSNYDNHSIINDLAEEF